jgi:hypothetical protein
MARRRGIDWREEYEALAHEVDPPTEHRTVETTGVRLSHMVARCGGLVAVLTWTLITNMPSATIPMDKLVRDALRPLRPGRRSITRVHGQIKLLRTKKRNRDERLRPITFVNLSTLLAS